MEDDGGAGAAGEARDPRATVVERGVVLVRVGVARVDDVGLEVVLVELGAQCGESRGRGHGRRGAAEDEGGRARAGQGEQRGGQSREAPEHALARSSSVDEQSESESTAWEARREWGSALCSSTSSSSTGWRVMRTCSTSSSPSAPTRPTRSARCRRLVVAPARHPHRSTTLAARPSTCTDSDDHPVHPQHTRNQRHPPLRPALSDDAHPLPLVRPRLARQHPLDHAHTNLPQAGAVPGRCP